MSPALPPPARAQTPHAAWSTRAPPPPAASRPVRRPNPRAPPSLDAVPHKTFPFAPTQQSPPAPLFSARSSPEEIRRTQTHRWASLKPPILALAPTPPAPAPPSTHSPPPASPPDTPDRKSPASPRRSRRPPARRSLTSPESPPPSPVRYARDN